MTASQVNNAVFVALGIVSVTCGQTPPSDESTKAFSVAVLRHNPDPRARYRALRDPSRVRYTAIPLQFLILQAFDLQAYRLKGPEWMIEEKYDLEATFPAESSPKDFRVMLQDLLKTRLNFRSHSEARETAVFELSLSSDGPPLKRHNAEASGKNDSAADLVDSRRGRLYVDGAISMQTLAMDLAILLNRPVLDKTGVDGLFDITLDGATGEVDGSNMPRPVGPDGKQLPETAAPIAKVLVRMGLALKKSKQTIQYLIVDGVDKTPVSN